MLKFYILFTKIEEISPDDKVVLELSSFQLMTMDTSPEVALITNLSPNHLDMHIDLQEYIDSKKNIFKYQNNELKHLHPRTVQSIYFFKVKILQQDQEW